MAIPTLYHEHETPRVSRAVQSLIAINVAMLFLQWTVVSDADVFAVLGFQAGSLQRSFWSAITYMFVHYGVWHLALGVYALAAFGPRLEAAMGTRAFVLYFLWCGLGGVVAYSLFVRSGLLIGASAAVLGVMFGYVHEWPNDEMALFGVVPVRAWTLFGLLAVAMLALGLFDAGTAPAGEPLAYVAHLGGLAFAWLYFRSPPAASIERFRQRISPAPDYHDEAPRAIPRTLPRARAQRDEVDEVVAKSKAIVSQKRPAVRTGSSAGRTSGEMRVGELDRVLDKISADGLESLTLDERALLDDMARRLRGER